MNVAPTFVHCVSLSAPREGRCACGLEKTQKSQPVPRPLFGKTQTQVSNP